MKYFAAVVIAAFAVAFVAAQDVGTVPKESVPVHKDTVPVHKDTVPVHKEVPAAGTVYKDAESGFKQTGTAFKEAVASDVKESLSSGHGKFTTKYDNIDLDEILRSDRLLQNYFDCLMDSKPCTPDGTELKRAVPLALTDDCAGCSTKQKHGAETVIRFLSDNKPELWKSLEDKYDPDRIYRTKHADVAARKGIKI